MKTTRVNTKAELLALPDETPLLFLNKGSVFAGEVIRSLDGVLFSGIDLSGILDTEAQKVSVKNLKFRRGKIVIGPLSYVVHSVELEP